ncbi:hypothetical protein KC614_04760 [candidate division WWE3 bacterium]|uniref:Uncharacterized protein n=1 Tax=candidate division WWE3 bacterium TaxID=2053526 RepID=A0A955LL25_UNCKA|nr:hypothetical protein [candidate division WWE3 bacterium]
MTKVKQLNNQNGNIILVTLVVVSIIVLAGVGYWYMQNGNTVSPTPTMKPTVSYEGSCTNDYMNGVYSYVIQVPSNWQMSEKDDSLVKFNTDNGWFQVSCVAGVGGAGATDEYIEMKIGGASVPVYFGELNGGVTLQISQAFLQVEGGWFMFNGQLPYTNDNEQLLIDVLSSFVLY